MRPANSPHPLSGCRSSRGTRVRKRKWKMQYVVEVPAMRGKMGSRTYYSCLLPLEAIESMFKFDPDERQWTDLSPEQREQRALNKGRVPVITSYILENEDDYLFASITASYKSPPVFVPSSQAEEDEDIGKLKLKLGDELTIN